MIGYRRMKLIETGNKLKIFKEPAKLEFIQRGYASSVTKRTQKKHPDALPRPPCLDKQLLKPRPPVLTIMGHVDHGKTTLLDALRKSNIVASEFGGITQHVGAFSVKFADRSLTFLDTPGHAAFSAMRSRGANCTDIVVLVVAAEDGVMEQTKESIKFARLAEVPIIVAVNKMDKPDADFEHTKNGLLACELIPEDMGGDVQIVPISALKGTNLDGLKEAILAEADVLELKADRSGLPEGVIIESRLDTSRGRICTALVQRGIVRKGQFLIAGAHDCRVRMMVDEHGKSVSSVLPGFPVELLGWRSLPSAGEIFLGVESQSRLKEVLNFRKTKLLEEKMEKDQEIISSKREDHRQRHREKLNIRLEKGSKHYDFLTFGTRRQNIAAAAEVNRATSEITIPRLSIVLKCDVDGSLEAIIDLLATYKSQKCLFDIVQYGVGPITPSDIELADTFQAIIYTFNISSAKNLKRDCDEKHIVIKEHNVIYRLIEDVKEELEMRLPLLTELELVGEAVVKQIIPVPVGRRKLMIAGCNCTSGYLNKKLDFRIVRNGMAIHQGKINTIRHHREDVGTITKGRDCGICFENGAPELTEGDIVECYETAQVKQKLDWDIGL